MRPLSQKMFRVEIKYKQVYDIVAGDYGILWIIAPEQLKFTWNTGMVNLCEFSH